VGDAGGGHQRQHAVEEADASAQIGARTSFLPRSPACIDLSGVSMSIISSRQVAGDLVAQQHADLVQELRGSSWSSAWRSRISVSLCWTSGWSTTVTPLALVAMQS
jgi:hypothetical protein